MQWLEAIEKCLPDRARVCPFLWGMPGGHHLRRGKRSPNSATRCAWANPQRAKISTPGIPALLPGSVRDGRRESRAELLLLANIEIGFHQQTRLQPEIVEALEAPVIDPEELAGNLLREMFPDHGWLARLVLIFMRLFGRLTEFDRAVAALVPTLRQEAQRIVTEYMMTIELPHGNRLYLGEDLTAAFPAPLRQIADPDLRLCSTGSIRPLTAPRKRR